MNAIDALLDSHGQVASVYLRSPSSHSDADQRLRTRWRNARSGLAADGASEALLTDLDADLDAVAHGDGASVALFRDERDHGYVASLDDDLVDDVVALDALPRLAPLLESQQRSLSHLLVVTDRVGAEIIAVHGGDGGSGQEVTEVEGEELHVHRGHPGGWSQRRFQQRAENRWDQNARAVADEVRDVAERIGARLIGVAGDVRASHLLIEHLDGWSDRAVLIEEGDDDGIAAAMVRSVADLVARDTVDVVERFKQAVANGVASSDTVAVLEALDEGRVSVLLVHDDVERDDRAWFDPDGVACSLTEREGFRAARLVDAAIRSARRTDADIRIVPSTTVGEHGVAAIFRW